MIVQKNLVFLQPLFLICFTSLLPIQVEFKLTIKLPQNRESHLFCKVFCVSTFRVLIIQFLIHYTIILGLYYSAFAKHNVIAARCAAWI